MPIFSSLMPTYTSEIGVYGLLAAVLFFADAIVGRKPMPKETAECCSDAPADIQPDEDATAL
jgi:hypothetical protein